MYHLTLICWIMTLLSCGAQPKAASTKQNNKPQVEANVLTGSDQMDKYLPLLKGKKVACIVNQTSRVGQVHIVDTLLKHGVQIVKIFAPEHGFRGKADAGEKVSNEVDQKTGLPIVSMYGSKKKPSQADLANIDIVLFDIQDVGVRFYTYISTLHYVMEACAEQGKKLILLDRPNPHADYIDGPVLDKKFTSFIGMHTVPMVYGMTIGEYGSMINGEGWLANNVKCDYQVIPCANYTRSTMYTLPVPPSPNLPNQTSILLYPSICLFEGTTLSLGRGTHKQFQLIGHPKVKSQFTFTPMPNEGAKDPFLNGQKCYGEDLSNQDVKTLYGKKSIDLSYLLKYGKMFGQMNERFFLDNLFIDKLAGSDALRKQILAGTTEAEIRQSWQEGLKAFSNVRAKYLIYP
jgi:uncharacterized protein YbbC (DUF1343 family)